MRCPAELMSLRRSLGWCLVTLPLAVALAGCEGCRGCGGAAVGPADAAASASASASSTGSGTAVVVSLSGGGALTLPVGAVEMRTPGGMPSEPGMSHRLFKLPDGRRRLAVSELGLQGKSCAARLDEEWARIQASKTESDPQKLALHRMSSVEDRVVAGRRVLYSEATQAVEPRDGGASPAAVAAAMMCEGGSFVLLMYVSDEPVLAPAVKPMLDAVIASYRGGAASPP